MEIYPGKYIQEIYPIIALLLEKGASAKASAEQICEIEGGGKPV